MDKLKPIGQTRGRVFNSRGGFMYPMHSLHSVATGPCFYRKLDITGHQPGTVRLHRDRALLCWPRSLVHLFALRRQSFAQTDSPN
jgi:hypothetical protein